MAPYLPKLRQLIKTARIEQAKELLSIFPSRPDSEKQEVIAMLALAPDKTALSLLEKVASTDKCDQDVLDVIDILKTNLSDVQPVAAKPDSDEQKLTSDSFKTNLALLNSGKIAERYQAFTYFSVHGAQVASALTTSIESLDNQDHDLLINLLRLTERTIPHGAVACLFTLISDKKINTQIRFVVYNALEAFPELESAAGIIKGISDPSMYVRMAAVKVLEKNCSDYIIAEIKNKIESGTKTGEMLAHTILDARALCLIEALMSSDTFSYIASNYLNNSAPIPVIESFIKILEKKNLKSTVKKYTRNRNKKAGIKKEVFIIISPSCPFLDVYAKLIDTCGYGTRTFTGSQEAFEAIVVEKPAVIVCDLFLNHMTGLDLAREVREMYTRKEVPIIISSLQKGLSKPELAAELKKAKVNVFCNFPATPNQIKSWINPA